MTMDKSKYPTNWDEISRRIRFERAQGRCEECGVRHGAEIIREPGTARFWYCGEKGLIGSGLLRDKDDDLVRFEDLPEAVFDEDGQFKTTRVILTVHHIGVPKDDGTPGDPHDKMDVRDCNLAALCQRCHLAADMSTHKANAKATRLKKKHVAITASGQRALFEVKP